MDNKVLTGKKVAILVANGFEQVEIAKLFVRTECGVIGDVVGRPDEIIV